MDMRTDSELRSAVARAIRETPLTDIHTHLYPPNFGGLLLRGVDDLLTYHYLAAETLRCAAVPPSRFWAMPKREQGDLVWRTLFIERSPLSEAARGVLTTLKLHGLDPNSRDLTAWRRHFESLDARAHTDIVFNAANVKTVIMTNDPFDHAERELWLKQGNSDRRFRADLRIDCLLNDWPAAQRTLQILGYAVSAEPDAATSAEVHRFLTEWATRLDALYLAASLEPAFRMPDAGTRGRLIAECVLPVCRELGLPLAMMIGVNRQANPALRMAGDSLGKADIRSVEYLCSNFPDNKFLVTMLSRENQHELCVAARKFRNLLIFGCWWFLNTPSMIEEITAMRLELLGTGFVPQHSDARVLDQLLYKWEHSRAVIADVLCRKYRGLLDTGWRINDDDIRRDAARLLGGEFWSFIGRNQD